MDNLQPVSHLDPNDVPEGFTVADPNSAGGGTAPPSSRSGSAEEDARQQQAVLEQALTPDALARLNRIQLVKADRARRVRSAIVRMAVQGQLPGRISEGKLIEMLERGSAAEARATDGKSSGSIQIRRKKYADSDDDDDDNDDDL